MKKTILFFALLTVSITAFSQVKVRPGVRLGLNAANITNISDSDTKIAPNAGLFVNIHLSNFYELQVETNYSNQGASRDNNAVHFTTVDPYDPYNPYYRNYLNNDINVHYVSLAIANKFFVIPDVGLHLIVGPSIDINVSDDTFFDVTPVDFALFGGIGYEFPFGLGIEARYKQGLIDTRDNYDGDSFYAGSDGYYIETDGDYYDGDNWLNSVFQLGVYYKFNF